ncbi:ATP-binding cassette domain-containing protein [Bradyrhizobium sp. SZCCHNRI2049]|uniref:ATP-binding cassette domain-containing protein n=1 Tax=Bradyrhizobium sp. SZCCHNRI2049 TaxID=3057287 RepID=UPI00291684C2|nr:ATP-binding cassette domain-containing protein [Bradyrhizobium sp. SZCCHNRI2049]
MATHNRANAHGVDLYILTSFFGLIWKCANRKLRWRIAWVCVLIVATAALNATSPILFANLIDNISVSIVPSTLIAPSFLIGAYVLSQWLARTVMELRWSAYGRLEQPLQRLLSLMLFEHIHALPLRFHMERRTGGLQQIVSNGLMGYRLVLLHGLFFVLPFAVELLLVGVVLVRAYSPTYLAIVLATVIGYALSLIVGVERQRAPQSSATEAYIDAFARAADSYLNYETVKYFGAERAVQARFDEAISRGADGFSRFYFVRSITGIAQAVWLALGLAALAMLASRALLSGSIRVGDFVLVNSYMLQLWRPLDNLALAYREIKVALTYIEKMLELVGERSEVVEENDPVDLPEGKGEIVVDGLSFAYDKAHPVLTDISFRVPAGRTLAVVGPSGGGKSTLARLLFRFYDASGGEIAIDGCRLRSLRLASLRSAIAVVPQDVALFNETLAYNIGIARPSASQQEIEEAARLAEIHAFIMSLPKGYETLVGERGIKLSGGEKQRVAIARAILKRPRIFVFDEATSALDSDTEQKIHRNLVKISREVTTLIVAHRLSTIAHADEIVVLAGGKIIERGQHVTLLEAGGVYARLWYHQNGSLQRTSESYEN